MTKGEIIAVVDTDKAAIEIESFTTGAIEQLLVQPSAKVPVGTAMAIIREERPARGPKAEARGEEMTSAAQAPPSVEPTRLRISPAAKQLAADLSIDLSTVQDTGPRGAIGREDIVTQRRPAA